MKIYTDKQGISHEETIQFDKNNPRDVKIKKWFDKGLKKPIFRTQLRQSNNLLGEK